MPNELLKNEKELLEKFLYAQNLPLEISFKNAHELRAPLVNILSIVNLLKEQIDASEDEKLLIEFLEKSAIKLDEVTRDINGLIIIRTEAFHFCQSFNRLRCDVS